MNENLMMTGTWVNRHTGDSFTVKDCLLEDNCPVIYTTDGRRFTMNMIQDYIQDNDLKGGSLDKPTPEDAAMIQKMFSGLTPSAPVRPVVQEQQNGQSNNDVILERAFNNIQLPPISISIKWDKKSANKLNSLHELMNIEYEEIAGFLIKKMQNKIKEDLTVAVHNSLTKYTNE